MASLNPQDNDLENTPPDGSQHDPQHDNPPTGFEPPHGQYSATNFERCFTTMYPFQSSVMMNLDRSDFRNLRLAGVRTPISPQIQRTYLIPTNCDEWHMISGIQWVDCPNTTKTVDEIKACHGVHRDDPSLSNALVLTSNQDEGGHSDSFNVCIHCHDRIRQLQRPVENTIIGFFYTTLCRTHCLEYVEQRPYNDCRCKAFMEKYWRCLFCSIDTLEELRARAQAFREEISKKKAGWRYIEERCPISDCTDLPWLSGPLNKRVCLCHACTAIFPQPQ